MSKQSTAEKTSPASGYLAGMILKRVPMLTLLLILAGCSETTPQARHSSTGSANAAVLMLSDDNFQAEVLESSQPVIVHFWAKWCPRCLEMKAPITQLATDLSGKAAVGEINIDAYPFLAQKYEIQQLPTVIIFQGGEVIERFDETVSTDKLRLTVECHSVQ